MWPSEAGIDVPLGWPDAFVTALASYGPGGPWLRADNQQLRLRATDRFLRERTGITPLSVSADKIAAPAMRAADLLTPTCGRTVRSTERAEARRDALNAPYFSRASVSFVWWAVLDSNQRLPA